MGFFRGTPLFVQILLVHFALMPALVQPDGGLLLSGEAARVFRQEHGAFFSGALALTLNAGAYVSEILRAGIQSIHGGQTEAAYSVGLTHAQSMRYIVLPQALRRMVPALVNEMVTLVKDSSLVSAIGLGGRAGAGGAHRRRRVPSAPIRSVVGLAAAYCARRLVEVGEQRRAEHRERRRPTGDQSRAASRARRCAPGNLRGTLRPTVYEMTSARSAQRREQVSHRRLPKWRAV